MTFLVEIPDYDGEGLDVIWEDEAEYALKLVDNEIVLSVNKEAMLCFAKQLLFFYNNDLPKGYHIHFDSFFCKCIKGTYELVLEELD